MGTKGVLELCARFAIPVALFASVLLVQPVSAQTVSVTANGIAWMTGAGCVTTDCSAQAGVVYQLWPNGLGPKSTTGQDGVPAVFDGSLSLLEVSGGNAACQLTIGGQPATVSYCGAVPGEIIDQLDFTYPSGVSTSAPNADAHQRRHGPAASSRARAVNEK